ncbi:MAG TPA: ABC transporter permease [Bacteroidota bacterium]|nr:ABC transporter permease [Bacteroidota bacterium]
MSKFFLEWSGVKESFLMAINAIRVNKLRSFLTLLGIVVGVFSIIAVMTAMGVMRNSIEKGMSQLQANTFQIQKYPMGFDGGHEARMRLRNRKDITYEQALQVRDKATFAEAVGLESWQFGRMAFWEGNKTNPNVQVAGENPEGLITNDWIVAEGRGLNSQDVDLARKVVILGIGLREKLIPANINPIGQQVRVDGQIYRVIGVFEKKASMFESDPDNFCVVPITAFFQVYGKYVRSINIMVKARGQEVYNDCLEQSRAILRVARQVPPGEADDFEYFSNEAIINQFNEITFGFRMGVLVISSIALLAAGIGIMNIMLVSVTERTREIGIRKAIGARKTNILSQFVLEAIVLSEIGGLMGILLGVIGGNAVAIFLEMPVVIPFDWALIGFVVCSVIGVVFGVYPAWKASNLDPIDSLRYE